MPVFSYNYFNELEVPDYVLCNINKSKVGILKASEKTFAPKKNDISEISFKINRMYDGEITPNYDLVKELKYILLPTIGYFRISDCSTNSEGEENEYKEVTAKSSECVFGDKYIENFTINMGTTGSIDGVVFCDPLHPDKSLLHLLLEKYPDWSIGDVDDSLKNLERCFEVDKQDVYSFLMNDAADAFECEFSFDTINNKIHASARDDENISPKMLVTYKNLLQKATITPDADSIKTCLTLLGEDDLTVREINMGMDRIYNFDYYHTLEWMSQGLYDALDQWTAKYNELSPTYTETYSQLAELLDQKYHLTNEMMPETAGSEDYTQYCLTELETLKKSCENVEDTLRRNNSDKYDSNPDSVYQKMYLPNHNKLLAINAEIVVREEQVSSIEAQIETVRTQLSNIAQEAALETILTPEQITELSRLIREDTLSDNNFLTTSIMSDAEKIEVKREFIEHGRKELRRVSQPQFQVSADILNLFEIPELKDKAEFFQLGEYMAMVLRDDYILNLRLLSFEIQFDSKEISVTFGNVYKKKDKSIFGDITNAITNASQAATSVSFNMSNLKRSSATTTEIDNMIDDGLLSAGKMIESTYSDIQVSDRGMYINALPESAYPNDSVFLGAGQIKFSKDGWETVETALGRIEVNGTSDFGLIAKVVSAGDVIGSRIVGSSITGSTFDNGNGTFSVDENGKMICNNGSFNGYIESVEGHIGNIDIVDRGLYSSYVKDYSTYTYDSSDTDRMSQIIVGNIEATSDDLKKYDLNNNGIVDLMDVVFVQRIINNLSDGKLETILSINPAEYGGTIIVGTREGVGSDSSYSGLNTSFNSSSSTKIGSGVVSSYLIDGVKYNVNGDPGANCTFRDVNGTVYNVNSGLITQYTINRDNNIVPKFYSDNYGGYISFPNAKIQICWKKVTFSGAISTAWGNIFETSAAISLGNWSSTFSSTPVVTYSASCTSQDADVWVSSYQSPSTTSAGTVYLERGTALSESKTYQIRAIAIGFTS